ncbi:hypothetical protein [Candidatus Arthromitus sp. SFB-turkey]|uniref:hypothetical protein n=1 Tax=Candidatus Arthromitus sp. SFB-turkey TaxID=1840217 RepID=UPI0007F351F7|nr:hypothetical protein [Candidatus Arthromitus sp. SFB-turkey]OAT88885.1 hypothetical protein A6P36_05940 [Candidatus Arthromitus sp. SFB-turkey]HJC99809.1 hypothetical protein [Candidatus Dwaynia gallinarum]
MLIRILISSLIIFSSLFTNSKICNSKQDYLNYECNRNIKSIYLQNMFVFGNNQIAFLLPSNYQFKYLHPFSLVSPSGKQLINIVPQFIDILQPIIRINLRYPLEEKGTYQITFTGVEKETNQEIDILGQFNYR